MSDHRGIPSGCFVRDGKLWRHHGKMCGAIEVGPWPPVEDASTEPPSTGFTVDKEARKDAPMATGVLDYFPDALFAVAQLSKVGNEQHNPGQPLHWAKDKSTDHADCIMRHLAERGTIDTDGVRHSAKVAWRALALLQIEIENERAKTKRVGDGLRTNFVL